MCRVFLVGALGFIFLGCSEEYLNSQQPRTPSVISMKKEKDTDNVCTLCLKTTVGKPPNCSPGAVCCYIYCCPCVAMVGLIFTVKERLRS